MELTDILQQIDSLKQEAENLQPIKPDPIAIGLEKVFWDKFRLEFNYNSNHMEGNTLTYDHTQLLLLFDKVVGDYSLRELEEMKAHDVAFKVTKEGALEIEHLLTEKFIKEINQTILVRPFYKEAITPDGQATRRLIEPGQYKKYPNSVRLENGEIFNYVSPEETPALMGDLIDWYRKETDTKELHPVQLAALFHYRFVRIHPFDDGNGRTTRLLMNYLLMRNGFAPIVIESNDKKNYLLALNKADTGDIEAFVFYIAKLTLRWEELYIKALKGEKIEEPKDFEKDLHLLKKKIKNSSNKIDLVLTSELFFSYLKPLIIDLTLRAIMELKQFDELFSSKKIKLYNTYPVNTNKKKRGTKEISFENDNIDQIRDEIENNLWGFRVSNSTREQIFCIEYEHQYLKDISFASFIYSTIITFNFKMGYYSLVLNSHDYEIKKTYDQEIDDSEIDELIKYASRKELEKIKSLL